MSDTFASDLRKFAEATGKSLDATCRGVAIKWFSSTVMSTPVDTGRLRGNWQLSQGEKAGGVIERMDPTEVGQPSYITHYIAQNIKGVGSVNYLVNNLPYAETAEYGSWNGPTAKVTDSGFSKQAPEGMVRINFARIKSIISDVARGNQV